MENTGAQDGWTFRIRGRVQGVGFRFFTRMEAQRLGIWGWVRNCSDGSVEVLAKGSVNQIERFEESMRRGPTGSRVDSVAKSVSVKAEVCDAFDIVY